MGAIISALCCVPRLNGRKGHGIEASYNIQDESTNYISHRSFVSNSALIVERRRSRNNSQSSSSSSVIKTSFDLIESVKSSPNTTVKAQYDMKFFEFLNLIFRQ